MGTRGLVGANRRAPPLAVVIAVLVLGLGVTASLTTRDLLQERSRRATSTALASAEVSFIARISEAISRFEDAARSPLAGSPSAGLTLAERRGERFVIRAGGSLLPPGTDLSAVPLVSDVANQVRDGGSTRLAIAALDDEPSARAIVMIPLFGSKTPPAGTAQRRANLTEIALGDLDIARVGAETFGSIPGEVLITDGDEVLYGRGTPDDGAMSRVDASIRDRTWAFRVRPVAPPAGAVPWLLTALTLALAITVLVSASRRSRQARAAAEHAAALAEENSMMTEIGTLLQSTPDISETLPSVAVRLAEAFDLDALRVSATGPDRTQTELFVYGRPDERAGTKDVSIPLVRAGRVIGELTVRPHGDAPVGPGLKTAAGLLSAAMANARAFEEERAMVERLRGIDQLKTDFLATISHEIRTPLTSIVGFAHILTTSWDDLEIPAIRDYVSRIDRNGTALSRLLQQVLDFSRLERGKLAVVFDEFDMASIVRDILERDASLLEHHRLVVSLPETLPVRSDPTALEQIVNNLMSNAVKFSPAASCIRITLAAEGEDAVLCVEDEGPGIPPTERDRIFVRFYRGPSQAALRTRGAGIGLAVVAELVTSLHGSVRVEDSPSGGARCVIRLPRQSITKLSRGAA